MSDPDCLANARSPANRDHPELPFHDGAWQCSDWIRNTLEDESRVRKIHGVAAYRRRLEANLPRAAKEAHLKAPSRSHVHGVCEWKRQSITAAERSSTAF